MEPRDRCFVARWDMVFHVSALAQSQHLYALSWLCREFPCLTSHDCVLTICLSSIAKCLFCVETLVFIAESRPPSPFTRCLLTVKRLFLWLLLFNCFGYNVSQQLHIGEEVIWVVNRWLNWSNFLFPVCEFNRFVMRDMNINAGIWINSRNFLTKYEYILNVFTQNKLNNKLKILRWHLY